MLYSSLFGSKITCLYCVYTVFILWQCYGSTTVMRNESKCEAHFMNEQMYKKNELLRKKNLSASNEKNAGGRGLEILSV